MAAVERSGSCETAGQIEELDQVYQDCKLVPTIVDGLILELYPPLDIPNMQDQVRMQWFFSHLDIIGVYTIVHV